MSVREKALLVTQQLLASFNTSNVSVRDSLSVKHYPLQNSFNTSNVSVRENVFIRYGDQYRVSIHPMCRFEFHGNSSSHPTSKVSIHPMCRFESLNNLLLLIVFVFQYIQCVGSSYPQSHRLFSESRFNTSNVSVRAKTGAKIIMW